MGEGVAHRAVHLRHAAQRVGVLHLLAFQVRFANHAAFQHAAQVLRYQQLSGMRARLVNALVEGDIGAFQRVEGERSDNVGGVGQNVGLQHRQQADGQHGLGAVDQRNRFLGFQHQRLDLGALQGFGRGRRLPS